MSDRWMIALANGSANTYEDMGSAMIALRVVMQTEDAPGMRLLHESPHWGCASWGCKTAGLTSPGWHEIPRPSYEKLQADMESLSAHKARQAISGIQAAWRTVHFKVSQANLQLLGYDGILHGNPDETGARIPVPRALIPHEPGDLNWLLRAHEDINDALKASREITQRIEDALTETIDLAIKHSVKVARGKPS